MNGRGFPIEIRAALAFFVILATLIFIFGNVTAIETLRIGDGAPLSERQDSLVAVVGIAIGVAILLGPELVGRNRR